MHISVALQDVIKSRSTTLYQLCTSAGISYQQGHDILRGKTKGINFDTLEKLCLYLNCSVDDLLILKPDGDSLLQKVLDDFPETENVKRVPGTHKDTPPKPFLQWVGGKREMIEQYKKHFPAKYGRYFEPFFGGGALFFYLNPSKAHLNDNNPELVTTYKAVRDNPEKVIDILAVLRRKHSKELYMRIRSMDREYDLLGDFSSEEIAARMIYLNQTCFNGIYRVNKSGQFNVPIGSSLDRVICDPFAIRNASKALQDVVITCLDFESAVKDVNKGDFVYLDPPYFPVSEYSDFTRYTKEKFYKEDQVRLMQQFAKLNQKGAYVMLSNSNADFIKEIYSEFNVHPVSSGRLLNSRKEKRNKVTELVITSYAL
jgi:DNA adenine methylase